MKLASIIKKVLIVLGLMWILTLSQNLLEPCLAMSTNSEVKAEICATNCELKCSDMNTTSINYQFSSPISQCARSIQKNNFRNSSSICDERKLFNKKLSYLEWIDYNYRGQFCSANLPYAICHLLI